MQKALYRPEIDGLRAFAVLSVMVFHMGGILPGGFVGVDIFFVISGFLITGIIQRGIDRGSFSIAEFWERRVRRIFPAVFCMVIATLAVGYWVLLPHELLELGEASIAQSVMAANFYFCSQTGYFAGPAELKPLLHTWSLAVEEQFYLVFPFVLLLCKSFSRRNLLFVMALFTVVSFGLSVVGTRYFPSAGFYLLPTRAWELLVGCILAVAPVRPVTSRFWNNLIAILGFFSIALPVLLYNAATPFPGVCAVPPVLGTAAIIFATAGTKGTLVGKLLSLRPIVFLGLVSYSLYLWHWPTIVFIRMHFGHLGWKQSLLAFAISLFFAIMSWRFIETPCRKQTFIGKRRLLFSTAVCLSGFCIAIGFSLVDSGGVPSRFPNFKPVFAEDVTYTGKEYELGRRSLEFASLPVLGRRANSSSDVDFCLWGDSHGMATAAIIDEIAREQNLSGVAILQSGQPPLPNVYHANRPFSQRAYMRNMEILQCLDQLRPRNLLLIARWSVYTDGHSALDSAPRPIVLADGVDSEQEVSRDQVIARNLEKLADFCDARRIALWIVKQVPETGEKLPAREWLLYSTGRIQQAANGRLTVADHERRQHTMDSILRSMSSERINVIDPSPHLFDSSNRTVNYSQGRSLYRDSNHLTVWGTTFIRKSLEEMLELFHGEDEGNHHAQDASH